MFDSTQKIIQLQDIPTEGSAVVRPWYTFPGHQVRHIRVPSNKEKHGPKELLHVKDNKHGHAKLSLFDFLFNQVVYLSLNKNETCPEKLVMDAGKINGLAVLDMKHVIAQAVGLDPENPSHFYSYNPQGKKKWYKKARTISNWEHIPYHFLDDLPANFFHLLKKLEQKKRLSIDYDSLASILATSYTLEEDDLHKGNIGCYFVQKNHKPHVIFFKIDHDLMYVDAIMGSLVRRPFHLFAGPNAFRILADDLRRFPKIHAAHSYWPTKRSVFPQTKEYHTQEEVTAFGGLENVKAFKEAKWRAFCKHILIPEQLFLNSLQTALGEHANHYTQQVALVFNATIARQAELRAVLLSLPEFRTWLQKNHTAIAQQLQENSVPEVAKVVEAELQKVVKQSQTIQPGDTPLHVAIRLGDFRYEETMGAFKSSLLVKNAEGETPLDLAKRLTKTRPTSVLDARADLTYTIAYLERCITSKQPTSMIIFPSEKHYINQLQSGTSYSSLHQLLQDISKDHCFSLKTKKDLTIKCLQRYIDCNQANQDLLKSSLQQLQKEIHKDGEHSSLAYIRQLRSELWIVRQVRGKYGYSTTEGIIDRLINTTCRKPSSYRSLHSFFPDGQDKPKSEVQQLSAKIEIQA